MWPWDNATWQPISHPPATTYFTGSNEYFPENPALVYSTTTANNSNYDNNNNYDDNSYDNYNNKNSYDNNSFASSYVFGAGQSVPTPPATNSSVLSNITVLERPLLSFLPLCLVLTRFQSSAAADSRTMSGPPTPKIGLDARAAELKEKLLKSRSQSQNRASPVQSQTPAHVPGVGVGAAAAAAVPASKPPPLTRPISERAKSYGSIPHQAHRPPAFTSLAADANDIADLISSISSAADPAGIPGLGNINSSSNGTQQLAPPQQTASVPEQPPLAQKPASTTVSRPAASSLTQQAASAPALASLPPKPSPKVAIPVTARPTAQNRQPQQPAREVPPGSKPAITASSPASWSPEEGEVPNNPMMSLSFKIPSVASTASTASKTPTVPKTPTAPAGSTVSRAPTASTVSRAPTASTASRAPTASTAPTAPTALTASTAPTAPTAPKAFKAPDVKSPVASTAPPTNRPQSTAPVTNSRREVAHEKRVPTPSKPARRSPPGDGGNNSKPHTADPRPGTAKSSAGIGQAANKQTADPQPISSEDAFTRLLKQVPDLKDFLDMTDYYNVEARTRKLDRFRRVKALAAERLRIEEEERKLMEEEEEEMGLQRSSARLAQTPITPAPITPTPITPAPAAINSEVQAAQPAKTAKRAHDEEDNETRQKVPRLEVPSRPRAGETDSRPRGDDQRDREPRDVSPPRRPYPPSSPRHDDRHRRSPPPRPRPEHDDYDNRRNYDRHPRDGDDRRRYSGPTQRSSYPIPVNLGGPGGQSAISQ